MLIMITIILAFTFLFLLINGVEPTNCSYSIVIETTCAPLAETTDVVGIRFSDSSGNLVRVKHLKNPKLLYSPKRSGARKKGDLYHGFERCAIDMFEATGACMAKNVCSLYVKKIGSDGWRPGWIKVLRREDDGRVSPISNPFYFRTFVPENVWFGFDYCKS